MRLSTLLPLVLQSSGASIVAPTITSSGSLAAAEVGIPQTWTALECDDGGGTVTWSIESGAPTGLSINASTGVPSYDGSLTTNQTYGSIVVRATNEAGYDEETFSMVLAYTPLSEGFAHWQRADQSRGAIAGTGSAPADTEPIGWLADLIAGTNPCRAEDDGGKPAYVASAINGKPALVFDGTTDRLLFDAAWATGNDDYYFFVVARRAANKNAWLSGKNQYSAVMGSNSTNRIWALDDAVAGNIFTCETWGTSFKAVRITRNGTNLNVKIGANSYGPFTIGSGNMTWRCIGYYFDGLDQWGDFKIAEYGHLSSTPDAAAISRIEAYLNTRYGLTV